MEYSKKAADNNGLAALLRSTHQLKSFGFYSAAFHNNIFLKLPQRRPSRGNVVGNL